MEPALAGTPMHAHTHCSCVAWPTHSTDTPTLVLTCTYTHTYSHIDTCAHCSDTCTHVLTTHTQCTHPPQSLAGFLAQRLRGRLEPLPEGEGRRAADQNPEAALESNLGGETQSHVGHDPKAPLTYPQRLTWHRCPPRPPGGPPASTSSPALALGHLPCHISSRPSFLLRQMQPWFCSSECTGTK